MSPDLFFALVLEYGPPLLALLVVYLIGDATERRHLRILARRESELDGVPALTIETAPPDWEIGEARLVSGNVVISVDYFKRLAAWLRGLIGGRIRAYESLLERARREAVLRARESARDAGFQAILNLRLETSEMTRETRGRRGVAGLEVLAFGTAIRVGGLASAQPSALERSARLPRP